MEYWIIVIVVFGIIYVGHGYEKRIEDLEIRVNDLEKNNL